MWDQLNSERRRKIPTHFLYLFNFHNLSLSLLGLCTFGFSMEERQIAHFHFLAFEKSGDIAWLKNLNNLPLFCFSWICRGWEDRERSLRGMHEVLLSKDKSADNCIEEKQKLRKEERNLSA